MESASSAGSSFSYQKIQTSRGMARPTPVSVCKSNRIIFIRCNEKDYIEFELHESSSLSELMTVYHTFMRLSTPFSKFFSEFPKP